MGCPKIPDEQIHAQIIEFSYKPISKAEIAQKLGFGHPTNLQNYLKRHPSLMKIFDEARELVYEDLAYSVLGIADQYENPGIARVKLESVSKFLAWMQPEKYSERLNLNVQHTVDILGALEDAKSRVILDVSPVSPKQIEDLE